MSSVVDISVVIGFKDWGIERLLLSVESILKSFGSLNGEVIVSDYGSKNPESIKDEIQNLGAKYIYTPTNGLWSRSRALNAGFAISSGRVLVSTDADMLFSPGSMEIISNMVSEIPRVAIVLQCRDLPEEFDAAAIREQGKEWTTFESVSALRPRWGMGGLMAVTRADYLSIRGFDERMEIYGGEDMDFAYRIQRLGRRIHWIEDPKVRMYHMWHPSSRNAALESEAGKNAIAVNRDITLQDSSYVRNTTMWKHKPQDALPLASVVISTHNRAEYLPDSINSVLAQTCATELEIIIVDDGSTDNTSAVVDSFNDTRIRYFKREKQGIAAARNFAATVSRSQFTVVHDDDDIMPIDRIENHFRALEGGISGTYGGWIDFSDDTGEILAINNGKEASLGALLFTGKVLAHATLMLPTAIIKCVGYDELLRSGSDYNLAVRISRAGIRLKHTGKFHLIRRIHSRQVTMQDSVVQKASARLTTTLALDSIPADKHAAIRKNLSSDSLISRAHYGDLNKYLKRYLPDHLVNRNVQIRGELDSALFNALARANVTRTVRVERRRNEGWEQTLYLEGATLEQLRILQENEVEYNVSEQENSEDTDLLQSTIRSEIDRFLVDNGPNFLTVSSHDHTESIEPHGRFDETIKVSNGKITKLLQLRSLASEEEVFNELKSCDADNSNKFEIYTSKHSAFGL